jgi:hypothetical protein
MSRSAIVPPISLAGRASFCVVATKCSLALRRARRDGSRALDALDDRRHDVRRVSATPALSDDLARRAFDVVERLEQHRLDSTAVADAKPPVGDHAQAEILGVDLYSRTAPS